MQKNKNNLKQGEGDLFLSFENEIKIVQTSILNIPTSSSVLTLHSAFNVPSADLSICLLQNTSILLDLTFINIAFVSQIPIMTTANAVAALKVNPQAFPGYLLSWLQSYWHTSFYSVYNLPEILAFYLGLNLSWLECSRNPPEAFYPGMLSLIGFRMYSESIGFRIKVQAYKKYEVIFQKFYFHEILVPYLQWK